MRDSDRPATHDDFAVEDPADGSVIANVAEMTIADSIRAVDRVAAARPAWAATAPRERAEVLRRAFELMIADEDELATLIVRENGKTLADAIAEVRYAAEFLRWYSEEAVRLRGETMLAPSGTNRVLVMQQPVGVCLLITPWNFPAAMITRKLGPALAAGCGAVVKPAAETPLTAIRLEALLIEAGLPEDVIATVTTSRPAQPVEAILDQPVVRMVSFTGSTAVGQQLLATASRRVLNVAMELGGNAPFLVLADADLDAAVEGALLAKLRNGGQSCTAANRFYVDEAVADEFASKFAAAMGEMRVGPGLDAGTDVGPMIHGRACARIADLVADAAQRGAQILTGGERPARRGAFFPPTVLDDVPADARVVGEEIFGPVAPIVRFASLDDAIVQANDTDFGLAAFIYTRDEHQGIAVGERLEVGMIGLNRGMVSEPAAPFGGVKQSGLGREGGREGIREFAESKYFAIE